MYVAKEEESMLTLVTGGSKSGKSGFAENLVMKENGRKIYLATMRREGMEAERQIAAHRKMREGKGFETIEKDRNLWELIGREELRGAVVLLECVGTLCANEMFCCDPGKDPSQEPMAGGQADERLTDEPMADRQAEGRILRDLEGLAKVTEKLIVVSPKVGEDGFCYGKETMDYIRILGQINCKLAAMADHVVELVYGVPVWWKRNGKDEMRWDG